MRRAWSIDPADTPLSSRRSRVNRLYFAYGSNLCRQRLQARLPGANVVGLARLSGFRLCWNKRSTDGSAKCNIMRTNAPDEVVFGAVVQLRPGHKDQLDRIEQGYEDIRVDVEWRGVVEPAFTYIARGSWTNDSLKPYTWYLNLVLSGARALGLPEPYLARLRTVETVGDPDLARARRQRMLLPRTAGG